MVVPLRATNRKRYTVSHSATIEAILFVLLLRNVYIRFNKYMVFAWAAKAEHACCRPQRPAVHDEPHFTSTWRMDDSVVAEAMVGPRPWLRTDALETAMKTVWGKRRSQRRQEGRIGTARHQVRESTISPVPSGAAAQSARSEAKRRRRSCADAHSLRGTTTGSRRLRCLGFCSTPRKCGPQPSKAPLAACSLHVKGWGYRAWPGARDGLAEPPRWTACGRSTGA